MFGIGTWELIVILVLALLIVGPDKLPGVARKVGRSLAQLRQTADEVKREINLGALKDEIESELTGDPAIDALKRDLDVRGNIRRVIADLEEHPPLPGADDPGPGSTQTLPEPGDEVSGPSDAVADDHAALAPGEVAADPAPGADDGAAPRK